MLGWGRTVSGDPNSLSDILLQVHVPLTSRKECQDAFPSASLITDSMICAGEKGKDACQFDSGGPLLLDGKVVGIVSWGIGCGEDLPGVYASVGAAANWIENPQQTTSQPEVQGI